MMILIPKNWDNFQHYKDRKPQWIKLHRELLNDFSYSLVRIGTKATLPLLWLLACEYEEGIINATIEEISFRIHIDKNTVQTAIDELVEVGYFTLDSTLVQNGTEKNITVPTNTVGASREEKRREEKSMYALFLKELKEQVQYKTKVTSTKDGIVLFAGIEDIQQLKTSYINHQKSEGKFAQRITAFMEDYNTTPEVKKGRMII